MKRIPLGRPSIDLSEIDAVVEVLKSGWLTQGPKAKEFEEAFAKYVGTKNAIAVNSCTSALHLSLAAVGIKSGDEVIVPSFTFVATANAVLHQNAKPVFADIEEQTYGISPNEIKKKITSKTKAIIPVHYAGHPCDVKPIMEIAEEHDLIVVEDAAEALGAEYKGRKVGSFGIGCFSFYPTKNITTGEGGMVTTNDEKVAEAVTAMREHGLMKGAWARERSLKPWERMQVMIGYNYRMTDFQAALGLNQLNKVDEMNRKRIGHAEYLTRSLEELDGIVPPPVMKGCKHVFQMYTPRVETGIDRDKLVLSLRDRGIDASVHFSPPVHLTPFYMEKFNLREGILPITEKLSKTIFTLPMYPDLTKEELDIIIDALSKVMRELI